jgi:hypothetical protein
VYLGLLYEQLPERVCNLSQYLLFICTIICHWVAVCLFPCVSKAQSQEKKKKTKMPTKISIDFLNKNLPHGWLGCEDEPTERVRKTFFFF